MAQTAVKFAATERVRRRLRRGAVLLTILAGVLAQPAFAEQERPEVVEPARFSSIVKKIAAQLRSKGLSILPDALTALQSKSKGAAPSSAAAIEEYFFAPAVIGTPPHLSSFDRGLGSAVGTFWRSGVVQAVANGTATPQQCSEFFIGSVDGESGGLGACLMAEGVGRAFETAIDAGDSICRMRSFSSNLTTRSAALTFLKGKNLIPGNDLRRIFNAGGRERLIKIRVVNETIDGIAQAPRNIFLKIPTEISNERRKLLYRAEIYYCEDGDTSADGFNSIQVLNKGALKIINKSTREDGAATATVTLNGKIIPSGDRLKWELDSARTGEVRFLGSVDGRSIDEKMGFSVSKDEVILRRLRDRDEGGGTDQGREYTVASIRGNNAVDVTFLAGAFKNVFGNDRTFVGATEYRNPNYVSAPSSSLLARAAAFDFAKDPLFARLGAVSVELGRYSCRANPDISIVLDSSKVTSAVFARCDNQRLRRMNFCSGDPLIRNAVVQQRTVCPPPP